MNAHGETLVLGDGLVGLGIAEELARRGHRVRVLGRRRPGAAWRAAGGMLSPTMEADRTDPALVAFARRSAALWPAYRARLAAEAGGPLPAETGGTLFTALHADHLAELDRLHAFQERLGFASERLDARGVRRLEPSLSPRVLGGLHAREEHRVDPLALRSALRHALGRRDVAIDMVDALAFASDAAAPPRVGPRLRVSIQGRFMTLSPARAVVAAGVWSGELLPELDPLRPVKGQFARLRGPPLLARTVRTPDVYLVPRSDGSLYVGASIEEVGFAPGVTARELTTLLHEAWRILPETQELEIVETGFGFRPVPRDDRPRIGASRRPDVLVAAGHGRHGVLLLPETARVVADLAEGAEPSAEIAAFAADTPAP